MTRLAAEVWRVHVSDATIGRSAHDYKIDESGDNDKVDS